MVNRRIFGYAVIALTVLSLGCAALIGFESLVLSENAVVATSQRAETASMVMVRGSAASGPAVPQDDEQMSESQVTGENAEEDANPSVSNEIDFIDAESDDKQPTSETTAPIQSLDASNAATSSLDEGVTALPTTEVTDGASSSLPPVSTESLSKPTSAEPTPEPTKVKTSLRREEEPEPESAAPEEVTETPLIEERGNDAAELRSEFDIEELMTPELIEQIATAKDDPLSPIHVHMLWIGDVNRAPWERHLYADFGYKLTVHTDPEEILAGFHPHVLKAYKLAIPAVVGYDFLKFAMVYKYGGLSVDADTSPTIPASALQYPSDCDVVFGKEAQLSRWDRPIYRQVGSNTYGLNRPFQILNWAMAARKPRNPHIKWLMRAAMMHFFGLRDMELSLIQDISGSGLMSDYVALLHEQEGRSYPDVYRDESKYYPVQGLCLTDGYLHGKWIRHAFHGSWKPHGVA